MRVAVVGASGFVGSHLVTLLERQGDEVVAMSRRATRLRAWGATVQAVAADIESAAGLDEALTGADAVVHLVAIARETRRRRFETVNVRGVGQVIGACRRVGVTRIVHLSALGVSDDRGLAFLSSKWRGEAAVRSSGLGWTVLRPSLLFGSGDGFFNLVKTTLTWWSPGVVAIPGDGQTRFQPLSVVDLAEGIAQCLAEPRHVGAIHELGGPAYMTYREVVELVMAATGKRRLALNVPLPLVGAVTALTDRVLPIFPVSRDQIRSLARPNFTALDAFARAFGFEPRPLDLSYLAG